MGEVAIEPDEEEQENLTNEPQQVYERHVCRILYTPDLPTLDRILPPEIREKGRGIFCNVSSRTNAEGKTTLLETIRCALSDRLHECGFLCEDKNRRPRRSMYGLPPERHGVDVTYRTESQIRRAIEKGRVLVAYEVVTLHTNENGDEWEAGPRRIAALPIRRVRRAIISGKRHFMTIPPAAYEYFAKVIPGSQRVLVVSGREDMRYYRGTRPDLPITDFEIVPVGWEGDRVWGPGEEIEGVQVVTNRRAQPEGMVIQLADLLSSTP